MSSLERISWRRTLALALLCSLVATVRAAAEDPSLQLYLDFEYYEPVWQHRSWVFHDNSPNGLDAELHNMGDLLALVPGKFGNALQVSTTNGGYVRTDGLSLYAHDEGVTVSMWARLLGKGFHYPFYVANGDFNDRSVTAFLARSEGQDGTGSISMGWRAYQEDRETLAFRSGASTELTREWVHFAGVYDPDAELALVYINGDEVDRADTDGDPISAWGAEGAASEVGIWFHHDDRENPLFVDELRLYSRALKPDEISELMQAPLSASARGKLVISWAALKGR